MAGVWITATDIRPAAPASRQSECVPLAPRILAIGGRKNAKMKQTSEYAPKQTPAHSTPFWYSGDVASGAPNTLVATAGAK